MDALHVLLIVVAFGVLTTVFSVVVGVKLDRWADVHGVQRPKRLRRISAARSATGMAILIMGASLGTGGLIVGGPWIAVGLLGIVASFVAGLVILLTGETRPPAAPPTDLPARYDGLAYFWHCRLPAFTLEGNRSVGAAVVAPPGAVILLVFGKWWAALAFGALGILAWCAVLKAPIERGPTRGPCVRAK